MFMIMLLEVPLVFFRSWVVELLLAFILYFNQSISVYISAFLVVPY
jgi:hypothetical protein